MSNMRRGGRHNMPQRPSPWDVSPGNTSGNIGMNMSSNMNMGNNMNMGMGNNMNNMGMGNNMNNMGMGNNMNNMGMGNNMNNMGMGNNMNNMGMGNNMNNIGMGNNMGMGNIMGMGNNMNNMGNNMNDMGNNMNNMGNSRNSMGMGNNMNMGSNIGNNNSNNLGSYRPSGGLLPTPNLPAMTGLLQTPPSTPNIPLAAGNNALNNRHNQQTNQLPSLLGASPNCNGLLPLTPPVMNPFNQSYRGYRSQGSSPDNNASNRGTRSSVPSRRSEPYNKMGGRIQRPGQNSDDRKTSNVSPRRAVRGPGFSPKSVVPHARNTKEEKGDSSRKTVHSSKEVIDDKNKKSSNKQESEKMKAEFADIPSDLLTCHVCLKDLKDSVSFVNHIKSTDHLSMMDHQEEQYKAHAEKLRQQMKIEEQQRQISLRQNRSLGKFSQTNNEYCAMCNLHFSGNIAQHRKGPKHVELKLFLHPRCKICDKEFPTRLDYDNHMLTPGHLKNKCGDVCTNSKTIARPEAEMKKAPSNIETFPPLKGILKKEKRSSAPVSPKPIEPEEEKLPDYDSQKEIGMEMLMEKTGFLCKCCNRFLSSSCDAKTHCRSQFHYDKYINHIKSQPIFVVESPKPSSPSTKTKVKEDDDKLKAKPDLVKAEEDDKSDVTSQKEDDKQDVPEPEEEEEEEEEDEGNWKRRKVATDDDSSMDVTEPPKESTREDRSEDQGTDSKDDKQSNDANEENAHVSSGNTVAI
ncbi:zinc finger protein on ecdysone puffs [Thrips palmi]|uniref:Zinc finger protein on ecdysone puffs n=1 Tax=Thrips palmi TaxID=161013 RepID=A0A6P8ZHR1_THRPL|nr:zinc finger protein on ecdysone puffs [Thrips palmi]